jgi:glycosyltransferase involved in cell wall biosynthesis
MRAGEKVNSMDRHRTPGFFSVDSETDAILPRMSVVICSLNGAAGVDRCIRALDTQTIRSSLELILVDDGSTDATSEVGRTHGAIVVRHSANLGLAVARNSGLSAATAPVVAFLDDDCEPESVWAEQLLAGYTEGVIGVGGPILPAGHDGFILGYLKRNNPLKPQEVNLATSGRLTYRLKLYLQRQWTRTDDLSPRDVYSFAGANMSFIRQSLLEVGRFDERFRFGGEELDLCMRMGLAYPSGRLAFNPKARVLHYFKVSARDLLRRSRAYGRGSARLYRKWPSLPPTFFPGPPIVLVMILLVKRYHRLAAAALVIPHIFSPRGIRCAAANRSVVSLSDAYLQLVQEACGNIGFLEGLWIFRNLAPESDIETVEQTATREGTSRVP